ncbi:MAG: YkgJ family cysteine cluster protein [Desulfuromonadaceae bacterium]|nr:YkgJ family cysteine cluster protein [Desulfuromonadaceae bacterium]MDD2855875.1 YkgJ family cysteine cluster protein [Desulfuromonadaceae bacterium]
MNALLKSYGLLLSEVDSWFLRSMEQHPEMIVCGSGCSECCRGLFDITLLDAFYLKLGVDNLPVKVKKVIFRKALKRLESLKSINPAFVEPWLLNGIPEEDWDELMPESDETSCVLLSENGECLVYGHRPMTCRLNGIPLLDLSGDEFFDEWCTLNFTSEAPHQLKDLRFGFYDLFARELLMFREFVCTLTGTALNEVDLFIPAAVVMEREKIIAAIKLLCR